MTFIPRKRCPRCHMVFEGEAVERTFSCDVCGGGHLVDMTPRKPLDDYEPNKILPRAGGGGNITHTRENF